MGEVALEADLTEVQEGLARLLVPLGYNVKGPGKVRDQPFYNSTMSFPRDVVIMVLDALGSRVKRCLDGLSSTGVLGIRAALECGGGTEIWLNDRRDDAYRLIARNLELNGLKDVKQANEDLNLLLRRERFDYVDVDPFGSPLPFLDSALVSLRMGGFLSLTATDVAVFAGTYPRVCQRRYEATPIRSPFSQEVGLRILLGSAVRRAAVHDLAATPILAFWREHYYKAILSIAPGANRANEALQGVSRALCSLDGAREIDENGNVGPIWVRPLFETDTLRRMKSKPHMSAAVARSVETWREEALAPPLFFTTEEVAHVLRTSPMALSKVLDILREAGYQAWRTAFSPTGFKTDAPWEEVLRLLSPDGQRAITLRDRGAL